MSLFKKQSGGFTGALTSLTFESKEWKDGKKPYHTITAKLVFDKDGADKPIEQYLPAGFFYPKDGQAISDDSETLEGGAQVGENTEFARFVQSAVDKGAVTEDELLDEDGNGTNFAALVNKRYEIGREINVERQMAAGRKKLGVKAKTASDEDIMKAGRQQDKNDKSKYYNLTFLVVVSLLGEAEPVEQPKGKKAAAPKASAAKGGKANGRAKSEEDYTEADALLTDLLADAKGNTIPRSGLSSAIVRKALENDMDNDTRDAFRKLLADPAFLARQNGWTFDADDKKQPVSLA